MRIIGGKYRSRVLAEFAGEEVRPTSDRAKESLFNILALKLYGARVLDLFAGSGSLGLESLSRGAKEVVFNDFAKDPPRRYLFRSDTPLGNSCEGLPRGPRPAVFPKSATPFATFEVLCDVC